jgi:beta-glucosidase
MLRSVAILSAKVLLLFSVFGSLASSLNAQPATKDAPKGKSSGKQNPAPAPKADVAAPKTRGNKIEDRFQSMHEKFNERIKKGNVDLLFIGDSITEAWSGEGKEVWAKNYEKRNAVNLGIGGDQTQHVLWRLQNGNLDGPIKPKAAVIMIGTNNTARNTPEEIASGIKEIVKTVRKKLPDTKILLLAVFPRKRPNDAKDIDERIAKINGTIKKLDDGKMIHYLDIGPKFLDKDGVLPKEIMPDLLHLSPAGYQIWGDAIEEKLAKLMGEK